MFVLLHFMLHNPYTPVPAPIMAPIYHNQSQNNKIMTLLEPVPKSVKLEQLKGNNVIEILSNDNVTLLVFTSCSHCTTGKKHFLVNYLRGHKGFQMLKS